MILNHLLNKIPNNTDLQTTEATIKCIGNTNWYQCGLCPPMKTEAECLCFCDTNEIPDNYFEGNC